MAAEAEPMAYSKEMPQKKKKVSWFKRKFAEWSREAWETSSQSDHRLANQVSISDIQIKSNRLTTAGGPQLDQPERALQFTVYNANGGRIVETRKYDRKIDRHTSNLYVITGDQDFGREIDKIMTMESLRA